VHTIAIIVTSFFLLILQATFAQIIPFDIFIPNLSFPIVLYIALHDYNASHGVVLAFAIGYLTDIFAGSPMGLHTFMTVAVFLVSRVAALRLFFQGWFFEIILVFVLACLSSMILLLIRALFDKDFGSLLIHFKIVVSRAGATAIFAPLIFGITGWIDRVIPRRRRGKGRILHS
jgi:rod shape-determining protein MreD